MGRTRTRHPGETGCSCRDTKGRGPGFLGIGVTPPTPEWGTMLGEAQTYILTAWYIGTFPGLAIFAAVMAFNLLGDGLRHALDPRMKTL